MYARFTGSSASFSPESDIWLEVSVVIFQCMMDGSCCCASSLRNLIREVFDSKLVKQAKKYHRVQQHAELQSIDLLEATSDASLPGAPPQKEDAMPKFP